jgi:hypothetical protein
MMGCSKENEEESLIYDENVGYLTNITSVKHGLKGVWRTGSFTFEKEYHENTVCDRNSVGYSTACADYEILKKENKFHLRTVHLSNSYYSIIARLDKDTLFRQYYHMNSKDTVINGRKQTIKYEHIDAIDTCWRVTNY